MTCTEFRETVVCGIQGMTRAERSACLIHAGKCPDCSTFALGTLPIQPDAEQDLLAWKMLMSDVQDPEFAKDFFMSRKGS